MKTHREIIECPECKVNQFAIVEHTFPWHSYVHTCKNCLYVIMESEWNRSDVNLHRLKPKQKKLIKELQQGKIIKHIMDWRPFGKQEIILSDKDGNDYYNIPLFRFQSLIDRKIIKQIKEVGSLEVTVTEFKQKPLII